MASSSLLAPFQVRSFRFQWPADLLTSWGIEMENLILGWYVLVETGSVLLLACSARCSISARWSRRCSAWRATGSAIAPCCA